MTRYFSLKTRVQGQGWVEVDGRTDGLNALRRTRPEDVSSHKGRQCIKHSLQRGLAISHRNVWSDEQVRYL